MNILDQKPPVIGAIDVGTNSFHMIVASVDNKGLLQIITREKDMVRLGSSGNDMKYIDAAAIERGVQTLTKFAKLARSEKAEIRAVATSAVREAINRDEFIRRVKDEVDIDIEVVSGAEEGRLIYIGTMHAVPIFNKKALVVDIGGGSTETVIGYQGEIQHVHSEKLGTIRLTKKFFDNGNTTKEKIKKCREHIKGVWAPEMKLIEKTGYEVVVGTSGTIQTLASMALMMRNTPVPDVLNGLTICVDDILEVIENIVSMDSPKQRGTIPGIDLRRADIITGGALILEYILTSLDIKKILISPYALREGTVFDTIQKHKEIQEFKHLSHLRYETVYNLCKRFQVELPHAEHVKRMALKIFDATAKYHGLGNYEREILEGAALLHDAGYWISHDSHHKHSYYLITHSDMPGFTNDEAEIIGLIARYHRKSHPKKKHEEFMKLTPKKQSMLMLLAGILRLAEGIDRRRQQLVDDIIITATKEVITIKLISQDELQPADIEIWGAERRTALFEEATGCKVNIE